MDGTLDGIDEGNPDGNIDGTPDNVGSLDGPTDGLVVGKGDGPAVGSMEGSVDGSGVGQLSPSGLSQQPQSINPHSISTTIPARHIDQCTTPLRSFPYNGRRARLDSDATVSGRPPVSRFSDSDNALSLVRSPICTGIVPPTEF